MRHGIGTYKLKKIKMMAHWVNDLMTGFAILRYGKTYKFKGHFIDLIRFGYGEETFSR